MKFGEVRTVLNTFMYIKNTYMLVEVPPISDEGGREKHVADDGAHLRPECFRARLPPLPLDYQTLEQRDGSIHLSRKNKQQNLVQGSTV